MNVFPSVYHIFIFENIFAQSFVQLHAKKSANAHLTLNSTKNTFCIHSYANLKHFTWQINNEKLF